MKGGRGMFFWTEFIELILTKGTLPKEHPPSPLHKGESGCEHSQGRFKTLWCKKLYYNQKRLLKQQVKDRIGRSTIALPTLQK